jgi:hypothetical protein
MEVEIVSNLCLLVRLYSCAILNGHRDQADHWWRLNGPCVVAHFCWLGGRYFFFFYGGCMLE